MNSKANAPGGFLVWQQVYELARPYGRRKLLITIAISLLQGVIQVVGLTSIFPFLALAADPERFRQSAAVERVLECLPPMSNVGLLTLAGICAITMLAVSNAVNLLADFWRGRYAHSFGHWLRMRMINNAVTRPYAAVLQTHSSILHKKISADVMGYVNGMLLPLLDITARAVTVSLLLLTIVWADPVVAAIASSVFAVFYLCIFKLLSKRRGQIASSLQSAARGSAKSLTELLTGAKAIKVLGVEPRFVGQFRTHSALQARLLATLPLFSSGPKYLIEPVALGGLVVFVMVAANRGEDLTAILPRLTVMAFATYRLLPAVQLLYGHIGTLISSRYMLDEVYEEFKLAESYLSPALSADYPPRRFHWDGSIRLEAVSFTYPGASLPALDAVNLSIPKNSSCGINGPTGSGKTTHVDLILGLHTPKSGKLLAGAVELTAENISHWRATIGYVPQEIFLTDDTILANVAFGVPSDLIDAPRARKACESAQILSFIESELPSGWETIVGERGVRLSGGQRQRLGLARALYNHPSILILDEATSALDGHTEALVMDAINSLREQFTFIIVAHRLSTVRECDQILRVENGRVVVSACEPGGNAAKLLSEKAQ